MHSQDKNVLAYTSEERPRISLANGKPKISECTRKCVVPLSPRLFQSVERLLKPLYEASVAVIAWRRGHVNLLVSVQFAVQVSAIKIKTLDLPIETCSNSENETKARQLSNR